MSNLTYLNDASVLHNLKQRYYAKLIYVRLFHPGKKKKENVSPFLFSFFFHVFVSSPSTVNRDESVDRLCTNENVGQRHRIDVSPRFFSYSSSSSSSNKIHPRLLRIACSFEKFRFSPAMLRLCNFFCKTRRFTKHVHVWRRTFLSLLLLSFSQKNWKQSPSSDYPLYDRFRIVPFLFQNKKKRVWSSFEILVSGHEIFLFFFPFATNLPRTNAQYHWKIDDDDDEKPRHLVRFLETTISIRLARSTLSFSRKRERRFANQGTKKKKRKKRWKKSRTSIDEQRSSIS